MQKLPKISPNRSSLVNSPVILPITNWDKRNSSAINSKSIDSSVIFINSSTRFTDGEMFGFGSEIGISTQKLHVRGPMGLEALTNERYVVTGEGTVRG